jgi:type II secretory pathway pseudopilin PulG
MRTDHTSSGVEMQQKDEQGFMLVGLIVAIFLILLALSVAAPKAAQELRREREVEAIHRGDQYVRAIRLYYRKMNHTYPGTMEQLEKSNNVRFLRQQYVDPMTGKADWRLIHVGEAKTTVKGFFGQPLAGLAPGLGSVAGMASPGIGGSSGAPGTGLGSSSPGIGGLGSSLPGTGGLGSSSPGGIGSPGLGGSTTGGAASGAGGTTIGTDSSSPGSTSSIGSAGGIASQSASSFTGGGAPFVGVGVPKEGESITVLNEQTTYNTWEFIYDPRIEQLYAKASLFGGASTASSGLGSVSGQSSGYGGTPTTPGTGTMPGTSSPTSPASPTTPTTPPQQ